MIMAFDGQTLTDYGTKPTYTVETFTNTFLTRLSSILPLTRKALYAGLTTKIVAPLSRMGRGSDMYMGSLDVSDVPKTYGESGEYTGNYEQNVLWKTDTYNKDLNKAADLDRRVWELKNVNAQADRRVFSDTDIQVDNLIARSSEAAYLRTHKGTMASDGYTFEAAQSLLDRTLETDLQDDEQSFLATEAGYARTQKGTLQEDRQTFEAAQSVLDRALDVTLQDADQAQKTLEAGYRRTAQSTLASDRHSFEAAQSLLDRGLATDLQDDEQAHRLTEAAYVRTQKSAIQEDRQTWEAAESLLDRGAETSLQDTVQAHRLSEAAYARTHKETLQTDQLNWQTAEGVLDRAAEVSLLSTNLSEKTLVENVKLDMEEELKMLEIRLDIWKINSNWMRNAGLGNIETWAVANNVQMFWDWTDGTLSNTNPW